jgi:Zn-dependent protease
LREISGKTLPFPPMKKGGGGGILEGHFKKVEFIENRKELEKIRIKRSDFLRKDMNLKDFWPWRKKEVLTQTWEEPLYQSPPGKPKVFWNLVLFGLTLITTVLAGSLQEGVNPLTHPGQIIRGIPFALALMGILLAHELGHYLVARKNGMNVTLPYFIPAPSFIGTFGAFIKMRSPARDRRMLMDIGAAGPLVGVVVSVPLVVLGLSLSEVKQIEGHVGINLGDSLLLWMISKMVVGNLPPGHDVVIHPVGFAGWIGLLVTSLNLLPIGQLDGGHVVYALVGEKQKKISKIVFAGLLALGIFGWEGWLFWAVLLWIMGFRHPTPLEWWVPLDRKRKVLGWITLAVFALTFIPVPFSGF